jgi:hypothetical protein
VTKLRKDQADDIAHALVGTLESYLEDEYGGAELVDDHNLHAVFAKAIRANVTGVRTQTITAAMFRRRR